MGLISRLGSIFLKGEKKTSVPLVAWNSRTVARMRGELYNSALWSCVVNLARLYATLPLHPYMLDGKGNRVPEKGTLLCELMRKPNRYMTGYEFRFVMGYNFEMHGEAVALIERSTTTGRPIALWPLSPRQIVGSWQDGRLTYVLALTGEAWRPEDVLLIRNTPVGYGAGQVLSPVEYASGDIELAEKCKALQKEYYESGVIVGNIVKVPPTFDDATKEKIHNRLASAGKGHGKNNLVMDNRIEISPIQIAQADMQKLSEAQKWTSQEVARRFNVPPFFIGDTTGTYNNSEQQGQQMSIYCLQPRVTAWEVALQDALCREDEYFKFSLGGLMRGDHTTRAAFYHNAVMDGWMTINEVRALEELCSIGPDGDVHFFPMNYASLGDIISGKFSGSGTLGLWNTPLPSGGEGKDEAKDSDAAKRMKEEKRRHELAYIREAEAPARNARQRLEVQVRHQLRAEIEKVRQLVAAGSPASTVLDEFRQWLETHCAEMLPSYREIYLDILRRMVPVVQAETGKSDEVPEGKLEQFAGEYADGMVHRVAGTAARTVENAIDTDHWEDDLSSLESDWPIEASDEEVNRSSNAFSVFLFAALHLSVYHVVAASDSCSFCAALDGKVASVEGAVLKRGDEVDTGDGEVRHIDRTYRHPPFHRHCRCHVAPGE